MIDTYKIYEELKEVSDEKLAKVLTKKLTQIYREVSDFVTKKEFNELKDSVNKLSNNVNKLSENLLQFQKETEKNFKRVSQAIDGLKEAQKKTEERLEKLIGEVKKIKEQLGGLAHTVGYFLEDRAYISLPRLLKEDFNIEIIEPLKRDFIEISRNKYIEINIIGKGKKNNKEYIILGECKTQLKKRDVDNFVKIISKMKNIFDLPIFPVLITFQTSPQVKKYLDSRGLNLYYSYQLSQSLI